jgi:hypothetical protein
MKHFLYLIMVHSVTEVKTFMDKSGIFKNHKESELTSLMYRALGIKSIRHLSRQKGL